MNGHMLRRGRMRGLVEGLVQLVRTGTFKTDAREAVERHQDYGFAGNPVDGEGVRLEIGGHTIVLRMDRTAERPQLEAYEVSVWHKEGHSVTLKAAGVVEVACRVYRVNASEKVEFNTPVVEGSADLDFAGTVNGQTDVIFGGKSGISHQHGDVETGSGVSGGPV